MRISSSSSPDSRLASRSSNSMPWIASDSDGWRKKATFRSPTGFSMNVLPARRSLAGIASRAAFPRTVRRAVNSAAGNHGGTSRSPWWEKCMSKSLMCTPSFVVVRRPRSSHTNHVLPSGTSGRCSLGRPRTPMTASNVNSSSNCPFMRRPSGDTSTEVRCAGASGWSLPVGVTSFMAVLTVGDEARSLPMIPRGVVQVCVFIPHVR